MLLLLAGTSEARAIAKVLAAENIPSVASLSGATREPADLGIKTRNGGFGGAQGFRDFLQQQAITAILDATHPFAAQISRRTAQIAAETGLPYLQLLRPWTLIKGEAEAADHIPPGSTVFLATGRKTLPYFANLTGRKLICRQIDPPDGAFPFENGRFLVGRPPFSLAEEVSLFKNLHIDWLVVKNAGGTASRSKLDAARELKIPVAMVQRPAPTGGAQVETVEQALNWVRGLAW